jgi:hypothetical protein
MGTDTLERWQGLGRGIEDAAAGAALPAGQGAEVPVPLGPWILALLLAVFVMETGGGNWHLRVRRGIAA